MANKRDMKKAIKLACGTIAGQCICAEELFGGDAEQWNEVIIDAAMLQFEGVRRVSALRFVKQRGEYDNNAVYRKARRAHMRAEVKALSEYMRAEAGKIADKMNELMPKQA